MAASFCDSVEYKMGDTAQRQWAEKVVRSGGIVIPVYGMQDVCKATRAPMLLGPKGLMVSPDLYVIRPNLENRWHDVKAKSQPSWFKNWQRWEHGIDLAHANEYARVSRATTAPVFLVVSEILSPVDADNLSALIPVQGRWMAISLERALEIGQKRKDWPGGKARPRDRGKNGLGGLLWARNDMWPFDMKGIATSSRAFQPYLPGCD